MRVVAGARIACEFCGRNRPNGGAARGDLPGCCPNAPAKRELEEKLRLPKVSILFPYAPPPGRRPSAPPQQIRDRIILRAPVRGG